MMGLQAIEAKLKGVDPDFLVDQDTGDMTAAHCTASQGVSFQTEGAIAVSATARLLGFKTVEGLRSVVARAAVTAEVCVLWLCIGVMWDNGVCGESKTRTQVFAARTEKGPKFAPPDAMRNESLPVSQAIEATFIEQKQILERVPEKRNIVAGRLTQEDAAQGKAAQVPQSAPVGEGKHRLERDQEWDRAEALARQLSSVRAKLDDAWIGGSGAVDALAGEISSLRADLDTVRIVGSKTGQATEAETKQGQALDQERERAAGLARELNALRAKLDAAWILGTEAVEAAEAEIKQTLEQERRRADALARELSSVKAELDTARTAGREAPQTAAADAEQKQVLRQERDRAEALARELTSVRAELDAARAADLETTRTAETAKIGQERALKEESDKTEKLARELASARKEAEAGSALLAAARAEVLEATEKNKAIAAQQKPAVASERDRADTLARELTAVRAELDTARASGLEAARTAEAAKTGQARESSEERDKTERLTRELASARKEAEARSALLAAAHAEVLQAMQTNEAIAAEQKLALARERDRADPLARELASVKNALEIANRQIAALNANALQSRQLTVGSSQLRMAEPSSRTTEEKVPRPEQISGQAVASTPVRSSASELPRPEPQSTAPDAASDLDRKVAVRTEQSASESTASRLSADEQRLLARANALLRQADISGARPLLEHALERGSARAAFMLAETYDARVLQSWRARGISGDPTKARELYERAQAGGIEDAKERIRTLQ